jgi:radical SAM PhpK family P-methyltransferase
MEKTIDCLFIGHNEMDFDEYEKTIRKMGVNSGAYRDLSLNFIWYDRPYSVSEIFNALFFSDIDSSGANVENGTYRVNETFKPLSIGENFSASIAYLGTYLKKRGFTFDFVNSFQDKKDELKEKLKKENILTIAITTTLYVSALPILEIMDFIRKYNHTAKIILGGPFVSTQVRNREPEELNYLFAHTIGADFYVNSSQGEAALVKIIHALKKGLLFEGINNIYYKVNGKYVSTPSIREENLLSDNMVDWTLFADRVGEYVNVRTSISCPFSCSFCGFPEHAGKYQTAEVDAVEKELKQLNKIKTMKSIHFIDDTFNVPVKRFKEILRMMIKNKFEFRWHSYFRCQFADRETVQLMKESGCEGVFLGLESGNDQILKIMNKTTTTDAYLKGIELLKEAGIMTFGNFIIGFPGETYQTIQDTVAFIEKSGLDFFRVQLWYCEPITPIFREKDKYDLNGESFEWSHKTMNSREASDYIDEIFLCRRKSVWVPQYNFDFDTFWHQVHRGMSLEQVGNFLRSFNDGVREKLTEPGQKRISYEVLKRLKDSCLNGNDFDSLTKSNANLMGNDDMDAEFDF